MQLLVQLTIDLRDSLRSPSIHKSPFTKGPFKKKRTDLDVVGWFLGGQNGTRAAYFVGYPMSMLFFLLPLLTEKHPKTRLKKSRKKLFFVRVGVFEKKQRHFFPQKKGRPF
jgi:hypothetical protein